MGRVHEGWKPKVKELEWAKILWRKTMGPIDFETNEVQSPGENGIFGPRPIKITYIFFFILVKLYKN